MTVNSKGIPKTKEDETKARRKPRDKSENTTRLLDDGINWDSIKTIRISFSGGKDSLALLLTAKERGIFDRYKVDVYNYNCCLEYTDLPDYIRYVSKKLDIPITIIKNKSDEEVKNELVALGEKNGPPFQFHYCNGVFKMSTIKRANLPHYDMILDGTRWSESIPRNSKSLYSERDGTISYKIIADWTANRVFESIKKAGIKLHWVYQYYPRLSCAMCPIGFYRKIPLSAWIIKKHQDKVALDVYLAWYEAMLKVKHSKLAGNKKLIRNVYLIEKNIEFFKRLDPSTYELKKINIPNCGFWNGPQDE